MEKHYSIGTPCQVATVALYTKKFGTNLFTVDVICHGVPSIQLFKSSLPTDIVENATLTN